MRNGSDVSRPSTWMPNAKPLWRSAGSQSDESAATGTYCCWKRAPVIWMGGGKTNAGPGRRSAASTSAVRVSTWRVPSKALVVARRGRNATSTTSSPSSDDVGPSSNT